MRNYSGITGMKLEIQDGLENPSGIKELGYLFWRNSIVTEALPADDGTTQGSLVNITGDHILKAGAAGIPCQLLYDKSGNSFDLVGEVGSKMAESTIELFISQITVDSIGGLVVLKNFAGILFVQRPGQVSGFIQIGSKSMSLKTQSAPGGLGTGTGEVGYKLTLKVVDFTPMYFYEGELPVPA